MRRYMVGASRLTPTVRLVIDLLITSHPTYRDNLRNLRNLRRIYRGAAKYFVTPASRCHLCPILRYYQ